MILKNKIDYDNLLIDKKKYKLKKIKLFIN